MHWNVSTRRVCEIQDPSASRGDRTRWEALEVYFISFSPSTSLRFPSFYDSGMVYGEREFIKCADLNIWLVSAFYTCHATALVHMAWIFFFLFSLPRCLLDFDSFFSFIRLFLFFFGVCSLRWPFPFPSLALWSSLMDAHTLFISCRVCCFNKLNNMVQQKAPKVAGVGEMWAVRSPQEKGLSGVGFAAEKSRVSSTTESLLAHLKKTTKTFSSIHLTLKDLFGCVQPSMDEKI